MLDTFVTRFTQSLCLPTSFAAAADRPCCLIRIHPEEGLGERFDLDDAELTLGRDIVCDVQLDDDSVSRRHARVEPTDQGWIIADLGSTNGVYVNDEKVERRRLACGDRVRLGNQIFRFLGADGVEAKYHEAVYRMMTTDGLTQAFNKRYLLDMAERELSRARRTGRPLSVVMFDIDHFKKINDTFGHLAGDEVLSELCRRTRALLREDEILARYGGEEFCVLLVEATAVEARTVAERLRLAACERPFRFEQAEIPVTISLGVAQTDAGESLSVADLLAQADEQLYCAKRGGRNRVCG